jgi:hypothetical protein
MQSKKQYDHTLSLKITDEMRDEIDKALLVLNDSFVQTRSEFLRMSAAYALASTLQKPRITVICDDDKYETAEFTA